MKTLFDRAQQFAAPVIIITFRKVAKQRNGAPTKKTTDEKIIDIYRKVGTAFREEADRRNEFIPASNLNWIILKYITLYEMCGDKILDDHLAYEIQKYRREGLRKEYLVNKIDFRS